MHAHHTAVNGLIVQRDPVLPTAKVISAKVREKGAGRRGECRFYVDEKTGQFTPQYSEGP